MIRRTRDQTDLKGLLSLLGDDVDGHRGGHVRMEVHGDLVCAEAPDGLFQMDALAIQFCACGLLQDRGHIRERDAPKEAAVLTGAGWDAQRLRREPGCQGLRRVDLVLYAIAMGP